MHEDHNIPCDDDEDDDDMEDDELTPKWKLDLLERAQHPSLRKVWRKDWIKLFTFSEAILHGKGKVDEDEDKQMDGNDDFFQIQNIEISEFTVLDSGKDHIDPESLKRWEDEEMLDPIRHLFITAKDNDTPIAEDQDDEQETNYDEDNAGDADSSFP